MNIISATIAETQPLRLMMFADSATGAIAYLPEPVYRHYLASGKTLSLSLRPVPVEPAEPAAKRYSEPRTLHQWSLVFDVAPCTLSRWFRNGQVDAHKAGKLWRVAERDVPR